MNERRIGRGDGRGDLFGGTGTGFDTCVPMEVVVALWIVALLILALLAFAVLRGDSGERTRHSVVGTVA